MYGKSDSTNLHSLKRHVKSHQGYVLAGCDDA